MRASTPLPVLGVAWFVLATASAAFAQQLEVKQFLGPSSGIRAPVAMEAPPGDLERLFIAELQSGRVKILRNGALLPTPFLDIGADISANGERGLLDLAFHPDYATNPRFYVSYTDKQGRSVVAEYRPFANDPDRADPASRRVVFGPLDQITESHNGGCIEFGSDKRLYLGLGDGGFSVVGDPGNHAQRLDTYLGKLLRLDVDAPWPHVAAGNPFVGVPNALPLIWAYGLRNPWRFSFDRANGDLWLSDVGHFAREEINYQRSGATGGRNYGWRCFEGTQCTGYTACPCPLPGATPPFHEYSHFIDFTIFQGCAITGGYVYRGTDVPSLKGRYVFADFCTNKLWSVRRFDDGSKQVLDHSADVAGAGIGNSTSFAQDARGELYILDTFQDRIWRIAQRPVTPGWTLPYGCGINGPNLVVNGGSPELGKTLWLEIDPGPVTPLPGIAFLTFSQMPDPAFPCGSLVPGLGPTPWAPGELLIDVGPALSAITFAVPWGGPQPAVFGLPIPAKLSLLDLVIFLQAMTVDVTGNVVLTSSLVAKFGV